ncbi:transporter substrate-binding domain-containing protein [Subdoligranulum sp. DSM 109015]|uniref:Transporter substrate-binding domain-containing protein n=1 Tax=Gemmiger gallinarum TaxID=2779354 RepID=A0ABR9QZQ4_9FIRM|nr:transporter substrate-binding domain-containing protein [Gemmiger gallinarum]MBE5036365.1 transporter substrate-binding domain-containing protein [Gemmiger gallinarum]
MKRIISTVLAAALVLSLAACSNSDSSTSTSAAEDSSTAATAETTADTGDDAATEESDLAYIKEKGTMIIGYTVYAPMNYTDDDGNFTGFDTELATAVCEQLGVEPVFQEINWETKVVELDAGTIDCIWNGMTLTEDIMENTACTEPYAKNAQVIVMKKEAAYNGTADLVDASIAYEAGSAGQETLEAEENLSQADLVPKTVQADCLPEVEAGNCQAAVLDLTLANAMIGEGTSYTDLEIKDELNVEEYGVAFRKGSDVAAAVNDAFAALREDGTMQALADKYNLELAD